ncbi:MAG TPA: gephyrin-like molybdotransferase Glp [Candidatus Solibacter sp.]|nr:gephyrin-like molybdotransferase Glp [Candidatus Solibacter sp.]
MLSVDDARRRITAMVEPVGIELVAIADAGGRVLAREVAAGRDLPGFHNSSMDGFAVRASDLAGASATAATRLRIAGEAPAGSAFAGVVEPGTSVRIMTGAPIPAGADAVVELEETGADGDDVLVRLAPEQGRNIRRAGGDLKLGEPALVGGTVLGPAQAALLGALGMAEIECLRRPVVALVPTGDEVVAPGVEPGPGQLFDAITPALTVSVLASGGRPLIVRRAADDIDDVRRALRDAAGADFVVTIGGVSVGDRDLVRPAVEELGELDFWRVAMRPGKPLAVGRVLERPFVGLPGNPVSALVGFEIFVVPALLTMAGRPGWLRPSVVAELASPLSTPAGLRTFARARLETRAGKAPLAFPASGQGSHQVRWLAQSNALLDIAEESETVAAGAPVTAILVDHPLAPPW